MRLNKDELEVCLMYVLKPILEKYDVFLHEIDLSMTHKVKGYAKIGYQGHDFDAYFSFGLKYKDNKICFEDIQGKVEYLFLKFDLLQLCMQCIQLSDITFDENCLLYTCDFPLSSITIHDGELEVILDKKRYIE